jgi:chromatin remodeling complex protein RSC6
MFKITPKEVEPTIVQKKGRKNKELAKEHFDNAFKISATLIGAVDHIIKQTTATPVEIRKMLRESLREVKNLNKSLIRYNNVHYRVKRTREFHNTGLEKLRPISKKMALFADWEYGVTRKSRYDVTNLLCTYIKNNKLQNPDNKTIIIPDSKLKSLLMIKDEAVLKYPTMQKYLKNCFEEELEPYDDDDDKGKLDPNVTTATEDATPVVDSEDATPVVDSEDATPVVDVGSTTTKSVKKDKENAKPSKSGKKQSVPK